MRELLRRLLGTERAGSAEPAPPATPAPPDAPGSQGLPAPMPLLELGLRDLMASGWFRNETGELFTGVPVRPEDTVLDVGCGDGGYIGFCARRGAHVIAVDVDADKIARIDAMLRATIARRVETLVSDCSPLPIAEAVADLVICTEVLEHVEDPAALVRELARAGKPGARYLLSAPDPVSEELLRPVAPPSYFRHPNHIRVIGRQELEELATGAGLVVESHSYTGAYSTLFWMALFMTGARFEAPDHPVLHHWSQAWAQILLHPQGMLVKRALDAALPKSQVVVARKPA